MGNYNAAVSYNAAIPYNSPSRGVGAGARIQGGQAWGIQPLVRIAGVSLCTVGVRSRIAALPPGVSAHGRISAPLVKTGSAGARLHGNVLKQFTAGAKISELRPSIILNGSYLVAATLTLPLRGTFYSFSPSLAYTLRVGSARARIAASEGSPTSSDDGTGLVLSGTFTVKLPNPMFNVTPRGSVVASRVFGGKARITT